MRIRSPGLPYRLDAEEAAQDALLRIASNLHRFEGRSKFTTWMYTIASNSGRQTYRSLKRRAQESTTDTKLRVGQVLLVRDPDRAGKLRLHRFVRTNSDGTVSLKGDANRGIDSTPVAIGDIRGVGSLRVPLIGHPLLWAKSGRWAPLAVPVVCLGTLAGLGTLFLPQPAGPDSATTDTGSRETGRADVAAADRHRTPTWGTRGRHRDVSSPGPITNPTTTIETWFKTTTGGGWLIGFGNTKTGASTSSDRHIYMTSTGQLVFGVQPNQMKTIVSPATYKDGAWHLSTATLSSAGMTLYFDGARVATDGAVTTAKTYDGYWRLGYDHLSGWPNQPSNPFYTGALAFAAVYPTALTASQIAAHYIAGTP